MTSDRSSNDEVANTVEFETALGQALFSAVENGINPRGSWEYRTDGATPDFEVMIVELAN